MSKELKSVIKKNLQPLRGDKSDYDSIIGMQTAVPLKSFLTKRRVGKMEPATGEATLCATLVEIDDATGLAKKIEVIKLDGTLMNVAL